MNRTKGFIGVVGLTVALSACAFTQSDADKVANQLRAQGFNVSSAKVDSERVGRKTKYNIEVLVKEEGCTVEIQQDQGASSNYLDEYIDNTGNDQDVTDFPKLNPSLTDVRDWVKNHKQRKLINC